MHVNKGFSLLEAIVALAVMSGFGMALFAFFNTSLISVEKVQKAYQNDAVVRNIVSVVDAIDPTTRASGNIKLGQSHISWESELVEPARPNNIWLGGKGLYTVGLYRVVVTVEQGSNGSLKTYELMKAGYQQTGDILDGLFQ